MVVRFAPPAGADEARRGRSPTHLDAHLLLRPGLPHPDLSDVVGDGDDGLQLLAAGDDQDVCGCPGG